jgi:hypothetical protein
MDRWDDREFAIRDIRNVRRWSPVPHTTKKEWGEVNQRLAGTPQREEAFVRAYRHHIDQVAEFVTNARAAGIDLDTRKETEPHPGITFYYH